MSRESETHVRLVEATAAEIVRRHSHLYSLTVLVDLPKSGRNRPGPIGGYVPDVFALDAPETCRIVGEAKTPLDLETKHSRHQLRAFLCHLSHFSNGCFYLSVPHFYRVRAQCLLEDDARVAGATIVTLHVLGIA